MNIETTEPTIESLQFIHITDTHLLDNAEKTMHDLNPQRNLIRVLSHCEAEYPDSDFILFTGDISQTGNWKSYCLFEEIIKPLEKPIYCVPGNHDNPEMLQKIIPNSPNHSISIIEMSHYSLVLLNSHIEDQHQGRIHDACLEQLEQHLSTNLNRFHIIALHHPPFTVNSKWLDDLGLQNHHEVMQLIRQYPIQSLIVSGHVHQENDHTIDQHRLMTSPSTCHQFTANCDTYHMDKNGSGYRMIDISANNTIQTRVLRIE